MKNLNVSVKADVEKVVFDKNGFVNVMVGLEAPELDQKSKRNPLCICAVIDRSGSMDGSKMEYVRNSMWKMIDHLTDDDSLSLVFFDNYIETKDFRKMTSANKEVMKQEIAGLQARGTTDIGSALIFANKMFNSYEGTSGSVERILLLTDGQANVGATNMSQFESIISKARKGVTLSTFGYGTGFNEELLTAMAKQGNGNNYFIENPDGVSGVFAVELGGLLTCFSQEIVVSVKSHKGSSVTNVLNDMNVSTHQDQDGELVTDVQVGDIYCGETRNVIVKLDFEKRPQALPRPITLADITVSYRLMSETESQKSENRVKVEIVKTENDATKERDKVISEQVAILEAASALVKAKELADEGKWQEAKECLFFTTSGLDSFGTTRTSELAEDMRTFSSNLNANYCAGDVNSKKMWNYAQATSTRGINASGYPADDKRCQTKLNTVISDLVQDFNSISQTDDKTDVTNPTNGYGKTRLSK
jgi:Ca-activated chloride channel family protein